MDSFREGLRAAYRENFSIDPEDEQQLADLISNEKESEHKGKTLDLVQLELFLICLENVSLLLQEINDLTQRLE